MTVLVALAFVFSTVRADLIYLHETWMGLFFPHQRGGGHPVLGRYRPATRLGVGAYWLWAIIGVPMVIVLYPFVIVGLVLRLVTMALSRTATRLGLLGVVVFVGVLWGLLAVFAFVQLQRSEFLAITAAAGVATLAAGVAVLGHDVDGRTSTILVAYPAGMIAIFLPPIVAALLWEPLGELLLPASDRLAVILLDELLFVFDFNDRLRAAFNLEGVWFLGMWFGLSLVAGWLLGLLVSLADIVRPRGDADRDGPPR